MRIARRGRHHQLEHLSVLLALPVTSALKAVGRIRAQKGGIVMVSMDVRIVCRGTNVPEGRISLRVHREVIGRRLLSPPMKAELPAAPAKRVNINPTRRNLFASRARPVISAWSLP